MHRSQGNDYVAVLAPDVASPGLHEYVVSAKTGTRVLTFPGAVPQQPGDWPFHTNWSRDTGAAVAVTSPAGSGDVPSGDTLWSFRVIPAGTAMRLLDPKKDYGHLSFVRPGEQYRVPFFQIVPGESADEAALSLSLPDLGPDTPERYAGALYIGDVIAARKSDAARADSLEIKLRSVGGTHKTLQLTLVEQDGSAWSTPVVAGTNWSTVTVPLGSLRISRSIHIPSPYPGLWNYWRASPANRGRTGDHIHVENVERLQLAVTANAGETAGDDAKSVAVESIQLRFTNSN
jgi:hypothetical protein